MFPSISIKLSFKQRKIELYNVKARQASNTRQNGAVSYIFFSPFFFFTFYEINGFMRSAYNINSNFNCIIPCAFSPGFLYADTDWTFAKLIKRLIIAGSGIAAGDFLFSAPSVHTFPVVIAANQDVRLSSTNRVGEASASFDLRRNPRRRRGRVLWRRVDALRGINTDEIRAPVIKFPILFVARAYCVLRAMEHAETIRREGRARARVNAKLKMTVRKGISVANKKSARERVCNCNGFAILTVSPAIPLSADPVQVARSSATPAAAAAAAV